MPLAIDATFLFDLHFLIILSILLVQFYSTIKAKVFVEYFRNVLNRLCVGIIFWMCFSCFTLTYVAEMLDVHFLPSDVIDQKSRGE